MHNNDNASIRICIKLYMDEYNRVYPQLPQNPPENFRLHQVSNYLSDLEKGLESRDRIYKKYKRVFLKYSSESQFVYQFCLYSIIRISGTGAALTGIGLPVRISCRHFSIDKCCN